MQDVVSMEEFLSVVNLSVVKEYLFSGSNAIYIMLFPFLLYFQIHG